DWGATACFLIKDVIVNSENVSISIFGNSGKISGSLNPSFIDNANKNNFIFDNRTVKFPNELRIVTSGNSWGSFDNDAVIKEHIQDEVNTINDTIDDLDNRFNKIIAFGNVPMESLKGNRSFVSQGPTINPNLNFYNINFSDPTAIPITFENGSLFNVA